MKSYNYVAKNRDLFMEILNASCSIHKYDTIALEFYDEVKCGRGGRFIFKSAQSLRLATQSGNAVFSNG